MPSDDDAYNADNKFQKGTAMPEPEALGLSPGLKEVQGEQRTGKGQ